jgi:hypothetical protein
MKHIYRKLSWLTCGLVGAGLLCPSVHAQSSDSLLNKLVEKGILTKKEADDLKVESAKDFSKAYSAKSPMPSWVQSMKLSGDFRGRYDGIFRTDTTPAGGTIEGGDRNRLRYRLRFGATATMSDHFEVGLRLASGDVSSVGGLVQPVSGAFGGNTFSANTTLNGDASRKWIFVDAAYAKWSPKDWFQAQIGKMDNTFWISDAVIDYDYQPEGAQEKLTYELNPNHKFNLTAGQWAIAENFSGPGTGPQNDTYLFLEQVDWAAKWTPHLSSRLGLGLMNYKNQQSISGALETFINQNGTPASGPGSQNFNPFIARGELAYTFDSFPMFHGSFPVAIGGEYVHNPGANGDAFAGKTYSGRGNQAYNIGLTLGSVKQKGNWQLAYNYKYIEPAALWHGLNDDDFGFNAKGGTDVKGHHIKAWYRPYDPLTIVLSYYITEQINNPGGSTVDQNRIFLDLVWSF